MNDTQPPQPPEDQPQPPSGQSKPWKPWAADLAQLRRECGVGETMGDDMVSDLEDRVVAIEELLAASGWRRFILRRQLARHLRSHVVSAALMDADWRTRRTEYVSQEWTAK